MACLNPLTTDMNARVDFHIHTNASDGTDSPIEVVDKAVAEELLAIAITDHDTLDGIDAAEKRSADHGITVIRGIELSAEFEDQSVHILGLGVRQPDATFMETLRRIADGRTYRNPRIVRNLNQLGYELTMDDVRVFADGDIVGRVHIAQAMLQRGYVKSIEEAFSRFIARGKPAYEDRFRLSVESAAGMIRQAGGVSFLAHPGLLPSASDHAAFRRQMIKLKEMGIDGVETHYPLHDDGFFRRVETLTRELGLMESGGSDYHGSVKTNRMGIGSAGQPITTGFLLPLLIHLGIIAPNDARPRIPCDVKPQ